VTTSGIISTLAGNGIKGYSGDGDAATNASLNGPSGVSVDAVGNLYIADNGNHRIRKVNTSGVISTVAGNGIKGYGVDGVTATSVSLNGPNGVAVDAAGYIYITDDYNHRIRKVNPSGVISTVAGNGIQGYSGDGDAATNASLNGPSGVSVDAAGNLYIADNGNHRIRKVTTSGVISTVAGNGIGGYSGDGGSATSASLSFPSGVALDAAGNLYIVDSNNGRIRKVTFSTLPLNLLTFTSQQQNKTVNLAWQTTNEVNTSHFTIQRSADGTSFSNIGKVAAKGDGAYSYADDLASVIPQPTAIYYRLQMVDKDGSFTYSKVVAVTLNVKSKTINLFPNPVKDNLSVQFTSTKADKLTLQVTDLQGRLLQQTDTQVGIGNVSLSVNTAALAKGSYVLLVKTSGSVQQKQFVKE
jgi:sugar lactone lactonase YvrE